MRPWKNIEPPKSLWLNSKITSWFSLENNFSSLQTKSSESSWNLPRKSQNFHFQTDFDTMSYPLILTVHLADHLAVIRRFFNLESQKNHRIIRINKNQRKVSPSTIFLISSIFAIFLKWRKFPFISPQKKRKIPSTYHESLTLISLFFTENYTIFQDYCSKSHRNLFKLFPHRSQRRWSGFAKWENGNSSKMTVKRNWDKFEAGTFCF